jgi:hypothetical protein
MHRSGFSLASLFVLIAVAAVFTTAAQMAVRHERLQSGLVIVMVGGVGPLVGLIVGAMIGVGRRGSIWGTLASSMTGLVAGALAGILMVVPESIGAVVVGSAMIVLFSLAVRRLSRRVSEP